MESKSNKNKRGKIKTLKEIYPYGIPKRRSQPEKPANQWTKTETIAIAKVLRNKASENEKQIAYDVAGNLLEECKKKDCYTEVYEMLSEARKRLEKDADDEGGGFDFDDIFDRDGTRVQYETTNFIIDYTVDVGAMDQIQDPTSDTAIDVYLADGTTLIGTTSGGNGVPDFVEMLGIWLEYYLQQYVSYGFNNPIQTDGFGDPIKQEVVIYDGGSYTGPGDSIYIQNTLGSGAGLAGGYHDSTSGMGVTPGHELFHQVQYTYNDISNSVGGGFLRIYKEGTARWAEDSVNDAYNRYNMEVEDFLDNTTVDCFSVGNRYETVLFWKYLTEQLGTVATEPQLGVDAIISLWNNLVGAVTAEEGITAIENTIAALPGGVSLQETFSKFASANYIKDLEDPYADLQYEYLEDEEPRVPGGQVYSHIIPYDAQTLNGLSSDYLDAGTVNSWGLHYYIFDLDSSVQDITVDITADVGFTEPFYRVIEKRGTDATIHEGSGSSYSQQVVNDITDVSITPVDQVAVIIGAYSVGGDYDVTISVNQGVPSAVLVIDHSGSMSSQDKMASAQTAGELFVDLAEANGVPGLGAVGFSTTAAVLSNSSLDVLDATKAANVKADIDDLSPTDMTSIGHGLEVANAEFAGDPVDATNEIMLLLSDGKENTAPLIADVQDDVSTAGIKVYTVGLGTDWAIEPEKLEDLATFTEADYRMTDDATILEEFFIQILASALDGDMDGDMDADGDSDTDAITHLESDILNGLSDSAASYSIGEKFKAVHVIASDRRLNVILTWNDVNMDNMNLVLVAPDKTVITANSARGNKNIIYKRGTTYAFFTIQLPVLGNHAGTWWAFALVPDNSTVSYAFKTMITSGLNIAIETSKSTFQTGDKIGFSVKVNNSGQPVPNADVKVISDQPLLGIGNYLAQDIDVSGGGSVANDPVSAKEKKMLALLKGEDENPFIREVFEFKLNEDIALGLGGYSNNLYTATTPGSYNFTIVIDGQTGDGKRFIRYKTITKVVRVKTSADSSIINLALTGKTANTVMLDFTPVDVYGNLMGPGYAGNIKLLTQSGKPVGNIVDHNNGTYSQAIAFDKLRNPQLSIQINEDIIPVPSSQVIGVLHPESPRRMATIAVWLAFIAIILALMAILLNL